jgi:glutaredoxin 1
MKIEIYGSANCAYCTQAKKLCDTNGLAYEYYDITGHAAGFEELEQRVGYKVLTVPQIFVDDEHLDGGYLEFYKLIASMDKVA